MRNNFNIGDEVYIFHKNAMYKGTIIQKLYPCRPEEIWEWRIKINSENMTVFGISEHMYRTDKEALEAMFLHIRTVLQSCNSAIKSHKLKEVSQERLNASIINRDNLRDIFKKLVILRNSGYKNIKNSELLKQ